MDFADLSKIDVFSVSKKEDRLMETSAAVYVITQEEIRRSGVTSIPEALRLAPGIEVARTNSGAWAITSRGFNGLAANKLLVLIDGRSVYTPLFSGVFWDTQDVHLDNIDRIEVIRGPGAAVWGANAVNGVINIIRKSSHETKGLRLQAGGGTEERAFGSVRYGNSLGEKGSYRVYGKYFDRDETLNVDGSDGEDDWHMVQGGFRADWDNVGPHSFLLATDFYQGKQAQSVPINTVTPPFRTIHHDQTLLDGGNIMGRWERKFSNSSNIQLQLYYDRTYRHVPLLFTETRDTYDLEFRNMFPMGERHNWIWGLGYRNSSDHVRDSYGTDFVPDHSTYQNYNLFFQDEIRLSEPILFTIGSKFEHNNYTGFEIEPNIRTSWLINNNNTIWGSVSRAVRTPTRFDRDLNLSAVVLPLPLTAISFRGDDSFESEDVIAYELGYRTKPVSNFFFDVASFYNVYDNLRSIEPGASFLDTSVSPSPIAVPFYFQNKLNAETYGVEVVPQLQITPWWRLQGQYSYLHLRLHLDGDSRDMQSLATEKVDPTHQIAARTSFNLPRSFEFDVGIRYVDNLESLDVPSYTVADTRIGWKGIPRLNIEAIAQNIFESSHREFSPGNRIERGYFGRITLDF